MSWISDLAGKAENILNKIDKNAANVLQQPSRLESAPLITASLSTSSSSAANTTGPEGETESSLVEGLKRNLSSSSLSLTKSLTPKKLFKNDNSTTTSRQSEEKIIPGSNLSSRRSSISNSSRNDISGNFSTDLHDSPPIAVPKSENVNSNESLIKSTSDSSSIEKELAAIRIALSEVTIERNDLKKELAHVRDDLRQAKGEERIKELETLVNSLANERDSLVDELSKLRENSSNQLQSITNMETNLSKARQTIMELTEKFNLQINETEQVTNELQEYRQKAKSTLQMKDKIIQELKTKNDPSSSVVDGAAATAALDNNEKLFQMELSSLRQENINLNEELNNLLIQVDNSKQLIQKLEDQLHEKHREIVTMQDSLESTRKMEQQRGHQLDSEIKILNQELCALREEMNRQRQAFTSKMHEKEKELTKLRKQTNEMHDGFSDPNNLENRMESLTQALVKKQSAIEGITAERNALRLQLEKAEEQLRHLMAQNRQHHTQIIHMNDTDDAKAQLPMLMRENPFDTNVARRVKRAYSTLDSAGVRLGVFLRRYPLIRIMVFIYVAVLHLWVMFVLLSSTPS